MIHDNLLVDEEGVSKFNDFIRDDRQMAYLFENFVRNFYKREIKGFKVSRENINWSTNSEYEGFLEYLSVM